MRVAGAIKPKLVVESHRVHHQRVSFPLARRIAVPGGVHVLGMAAPVHEDLPVGMHVSLHQEDDQLWGLDNLPWIRSHAWYASRQAIRVRIVFRQALLGELERARSFFIIRLPLYSDAEDPATIFRPSASVTDLAVASFEPSLARTPTTVTSPPTWRKSLVQPSRRSALGLASSRFQVVTFPLSSFTSMMKRA